MLWKRGSDRSDNVHRLRRECEDRWSCSRTSPDAVHICAAIISWISARRSPTTTPTIQGCSCATPCPASLPPKNSQPSCSVRPPMLTSHTRANRRQFSLVAAQSLDQDRYLLLVTYSDRLTNSKGSLIDVEARILNAERKEASKTSGHCQDFARDANVF